MRISTLAATLVAATTAMAMPFPFGAPVADLFPRQDTSTTDPSLLPSSGEGSILPSGSGSDSDDADSSSSSTTCSNGLLTGGCSAGSSSNSTSAASSSECGVLSGCTSGSATACDDKGDENVDQTSSSLCGSSTDTSSSGVISLMYRIFRRYDVAARRAWDNHFRRNI